MKTRARGDDKIVGNSMKMMLTHGEKSITWREGLGDSIEDRGYSMAIESQPLLGVIHINFSKRFPATYAATLTGDGCPVD